MKNMTAEIGLILKSDFLNSSVSNESWMMNILLIILTSLIYFTYQPQSPQDSSHADDQIKRILIYYTNDEHGWLEPNKNNDGAPGLMGSWKEKDDFNFDGPFLLLSGGDMWTGPAISTLSAGKSMVEIMNSLGYDAAAIGNHEFDFSIDTLKKRQSEMAFPLLAANIREKVSGDIPDFATPYIIKKINDVSIGIIGLTTTSVPTTTKPANVSDYNFTPYKNELTEIFPEVKAEGAELVILIGHLCYDEMIELIPLAKKYGIVLIGGGHCHQIINEKQEGILLVQSGAQYDNYSRVELFFDDDADTLVSITSSLHANSDGILDMSVDAIVNKWRTRLDGALSQVIGYAAEDIYEKSNEMWNMITDSWLYVYPTAQIALTNTGGIRQSIPKGNITTEQIFGLLPFDNNILELNLSGKELIDCITSDIVFSGMIKEQDDYFLADGRPLEDDTIYQVLTNDYLYSRPDLNYQKYDEDPYDTSIKYRQPLIDWLKSVNSTKDNPLNAYLDSLSRK
jgi:2',3'-cyclic-nucleotide 2'-phosphodiesterase (5'-nucleotidase family)